MTPYTSLLPLQCLCFSQSPNNLNFPTSTRNIAARNKESRTILASPSSSTADPPRSAPFQVEATEFQLCTMSPGLWSVDNFWHNFWSGFRGHCSSRWMGILFTSFQPCSSLQQTARQTDMLYIYIYHPLQFDPFSVFSRSPFFMFPFSSSRSLALLRVPFLPSSSLALLISSQPS